MQNPNPFVAPTGSRQGARPCPACRQRLQLLPLPGPHGQAVDVEHCHDCRLVWFDPLELDGIAQPGWVALLLAMETARRHTNVAPAPFTENGQCPRCHSVLKPQQQVSSHGRYTALACPQGHGQAQRDGALLASRGLFRPLLLAERVALATEARQLFCLPCGAPLDGGAERCLACDSAATVFDLPRLAAAVGLKPQRRHATAGAQPPADAPLMPWPCHACGAALDAMAHTHCVQCRHPVLAPLLADLLPLLRTAQAQHEDAVPAAARGALRNMPTGQRARIGRLTGRAEHRAAVELLELRFWQRWRWVVAAFCVLCLMAWWRS